MRTSGSYLQNLPLILNLQMKGSFGVIFSYKKYFVNDCKW